MSKGAEIWVINPVAEQLSGAKALQIDPNTNMKIVLRHVTRRLQCLTLGKMIPAIDTHQSREVLMMALRSIIRSRAENGSSSLSSRSSP
ncbi:hypothetical protein E4U59_003826 [Claviceps monticola]|nr:hypothetical protein E4U59_003826 [Claviceps monticola]